MSLRNPPNPPCVEGPTITFTTHPNSCSFMRVYCSECGFIGNTEFQDHLPPCPWPNAPKEKE